MQNPWVAECPSLFVRRAQYRNGPYTTALKYRCNRRVSVVGRSLSLRRCGSLPWLRHLVAFPNERGMHLRALRRHELFLGSPPCSPDSAGSGPSSSLCWLASALDPSRGCLSSLALS